LLFQIACSRSKPAPAVLFDQIRLTFLQGDLARARLEADRAFKQFLGQNAEWAWRFRLLEAEILANQGLSQDVLSLLNPPLPDFLADGDLGVRQHMLKALAYAHLGSFPEAELNFHEAERLCSQAQCKVGGEVARAGGVIEADRDDMEKAKDFFRKSLQIARDQGDQFLEASDRLNLGVVAIGKERFDESVSWSEEAMALARVLHAGLTEEKAVGNQGWAYYKMGDYDRALEFFQAATRKSQELGAEIDQVEWLNDQGMVYFQAGQFDLAGENYRQSLQLARTRQNKVQTLEALTALGFLSARTGNLDAAKAYSDEALRLSHDEGYRSDELYALLVQGLIAARTNDANRAEQLLFDVAKDSKSDTSLRWEAHDELAGLYERQNQPALAEKQYRQSLNILEGSRGSLRHEEFRLPFLANAAHLYDHYLHFLVHRGNSAAALQVADFSRARTLMEGLGLLKGQTTSHPPAIDAQQVAMRLGGTILFYWLGDTESYLWAVTPSQTKLFRLPARSEIEARIQRYRRALLGPVNVLETSNPDGLELYSLLVGPAAGLIPPQSRVIVIPDGALNNLNFETLLVAQPRPHFWIEDVTITNANSLRLLASPHTRSAGPATLLLIGDAVAGDRQYPELPNAAAEMAGVESHFAPAARQVLARDEATAAAYLTGNPARFSYIHFVAHGTASLLSPLDSAIVLSKSPQDNSDKLYARDIIEHPLHAELVTISSCYGEGTRAYTGEGLVGLSWAFLRAGAHNVVGALWQASDTSTPQLMDHFYRELENRHSPEEALRTAKLEMLRAGGVFRKPAYWAPFQIYVGFK
jgi:CHAT domain-containing protein